MGNRKQITAGYIIILMCAVLWGAIGISVRYISGFEISTLQNSCFRIFTTTFILFLAILLTGRQKFNICLTDLKYFFGSGICSILLNNICYAMSVQINSLSIAAILLYTAPLLVILLAAILFKEKLTVRKMTALMMCFIGCILVVGIGIVREHSLSIVGILAGFGSALGYALYNIFAKILTGKYESLTLTFYTFLFALAGIIPMADVPTMIRQIAIMPERIPLAMLGAALTSALPYLLFPIALRYVESGKASIVATFEVVASTLFGMILYHEKIGLLNGVGIVMIVGAVILLNLSEKRK